MTQFVFAFDHAHEVPPKDLKHLLGGKGANLAEMTSVLGLPVPPGFTISTEACRAFMDEGWPAGLDEQVREALGVLEARMGKRLGDPHDPLLVSVRSGAQFSMPGMMDTVLNLGLNDASVEGLSSQTDDPRFAYDSYRRFIAMYARIVQGVESEEFDRLLEAAKERAGVSSDGEIPAEFLRSLVDDYKHLVERTTGAPFPQDPSVQIRGAIEAVFASWNGPRAVAYREREHIDHRLGTAVNVQVMVFGNRDDRSGTGVGFTRDPATGEQGIYGDFLVNAQGEDVVAGVRHPLPLSELASLFPDCFQELMDIFARLERHFRDMCDVEFTIEQGKLWMLQTRVGKRTGRAALRMAVDMTRDPAIALTREEALLRITPDHLDQMLHPQFASHGYAPLTRGLGASPGAAVGKIVLTSEAAVEAAQHGESVILVRKETSPDDVQGMLAAAGILTSRGGLVSHAAVVARGWGKPAVVGADQLVVQEHQVLVGDVVLHEGDVISIDGTSGDVVQGALDLEVAAFPEELELALAWADEIAAGRIGVRANADSGPDAEVARRFGAKGIGLCRTEHMFLAEDRLPIVRRMILAASPDEEEAALAELRAAQRQDFAAILAAMDGLPVTVRLLDPPLHEFLPDVESLLVRESTRGLSDEEQRLLTAAKSWREANPMLGVRGVRLGVLKPGLYTMQVLALLEAARDLKARGGDPHVEVMIPLTVAKAELAFAHRWVEEAVALVGEADLDILFGTMIETPRAALMAAEIAEVAEFFSFGTNDLTQLTYGFSRDDVEGKLMPTYLAEGLLEINPFKSVDAEGVIELVNIAVKRGRSTRPDLKLGVCGEHGGDPASIANFLKVGLDYVSCSPYRVPIARLAAAQAVIREVS